MRILLNTCNWCILTGWIVLHTAVFSSDCGIWTKERFPLFVVFWVLLFVVVAWVIIASGYYLCILRIRFMEFLENLKIESIKCIILCWDILRSTALHSAEVYLRCYWLHSHLSATTQLRPSLVPSKHWYLDRIVKEVGSLWLFILFSTGFILPCDIIAWFLSFSLSREFVSARYGIISVGLYRRIAKFSSCIATDIAGLVINVYREMSHFHLP